MYRASTSSSTGEVSISVAQTILAPASSSSSRGFGLKLSSAAGGGLGVGAPEADLAWYIRTRPVVSIKDASSISHTPDTIDPKTGQGQVTRIVVRVQPRMQFLSEQTAASLRVRAQVRSYDSERLSLQDEIWSEYTDTSGSIAFTFDPKNNFGIDSENLNVAEDLRPLNFEVHLEYSLPACASTYARPCPMFDPAGDETLELVAADTLRTRTPIRDQISFNICQDPASCECRVEAEVSPAPAIVPGQDKSGQLVLAALRLTNTGTEPSVVNSLVVRGLDTARYTLDKLWTHGSWALAGDTATAKLPFLNKATSSKVDLAQVSSRQFSLSVRAAADIPPDVTSITLTLEVKAKCKDQSDIVKTVNAMQCSYCSCPNSSTCRCRCLWRCSTSGASARWRRRRRPRPSSPGTRGTSWSRRRPGRPCSSGVSLVTAACAAQEQCHCPGTP